MYLILNFLLVFWEIFQNIFRIETLTVMTIGEKVYLGVIVIFLIRPIYLLLINIYYIMRKKVTYTKSVITMLSVIIAHILVLFINNKFKFGTFLADIPAGLIMLMIFVPWTIIIIGTLACYFLQKTIKHRK